MHNVVNYASRIGRKILNIPHTKMSSNFTYQDAVQKLNSLQSNQAAINQIKRDIKLGVEKCMNIAHMEDYLSRIGISMSKLDELSVIHVAGTKGKGSTSAMCESILRHHGFKTGFYSSPHLVAVCERIRLEGQVIGKEKFAKYFLDVYDKLQSSQAYEGDMPKYFAFLTVLAFDIFIKEKVDVAIVEVGIGGIVDYTNVVRKVPVVGITALGLDHTSILGNTIEQIAAAKAGIMKHNCEAYTVKQPAEAMAVLERVARETNCTIHEAPDYREYAFPKDYKCQLHIDLDAYYVNASLAIQLAHAWIRVTGTGKKSTKTINSQKDEFNGMHQNGDTGVKTLSEQTILGLRDCRWPGRYQQLRSDYAMFFIDGAHTKESMEICSKWFKGNVHGGDHDKYLIFSATGDRDGEVLLRPLKDILFRRVYFVAPTAFKEINEKNDNYSALERRELLSRCEKHAETWTHILGRNSEVKTLACVNEALVDIKSENKHPDVLITGSLHLVGAALSILDRSLSRD